MSQNFVSHHKAAGLQYKVIMIITRKAAVLVFYEDTSIGCEERKMESISKEESMNKEGESRRGEDMLQPPALTILPSPLSAPDDLRPCPSLRWFLQLIVLQVLSESVEWYL